MRAFATAAAILVTLLVPAPALAATAAVSNDRLTVTGGPGEANDLNLFQYPSDDDVYVRVRDAGVGAGLSTGSGCGPYQGDVWCGPVDSIVVNAGDGNDKVTSEGGVRATLLGGRGNDELYGGSGEDFVDGQEDADLISGGFGDDDLRGGSGPDTVTYSYQWLPVYVDADGVADDGPVGGDDNVRTDVENLTGGRASDTLTGSAGPNVLTGAEGNDTLRGLDGDDQLVGGSGRDTLEGDAGADSLHALDGAVDNSSCGGGHDFVLADPEDNLAGDCETTTLSNTLAGPLPAPPAQPVRIARKPVEVSSSGLATLRLRCARDAGARCSGRVTLIQARRGAKTSSRRRQRGVLGTASFSVRSGRVAKVKVRLSRNGRRRVMRKRRIRCRVSVAVRRRGGATTIVNGAITLSAPGEGAR